MPKTNNTLSFLSLSPGEGNWLFETNDPALFEKVKACLVPVAGNRQRAWKMGDVPLENAGHIAKLCKEYMEELEVAHAE